MFRFFQSLEQFASNPFGAAAIGATVALAIHPVLHRLFPLSGQLSSQPQNNGVVKK